MLRTAVSLVVLVGLTAPAHANEIWVAPTYQQDVGGLGVGSNGIWPVTAAGVARLAWAIPNDLKTFQGARLVLIPQAAAASATLTLFVCKAASSEMVTAACAGPITQTFASTANQLLELDVSTALAPHLGTPGLNHIAVIAYTPSTAATDRILGLRFAYEPTLPAGAATLGANTFAGTQTAPAFAGDGAAITNVNANRLDGFDSSAFARSVHGHDVSQVKNAASLGVNTFVGTQTIDAGHLNLTSADTVITRNGGRLLHGLTQNIFLHGGNATYTGLDNTGLGFSTLGGITHGNRNTAVGHSALPQVTSGDDNTAVGSDSLFWNNSGDRNTAVGRRALFGRPTGSNTGSDNTAIGASALNGTTSGTGNTAIGALALDDNTTGTNNVGVGSGAGASATVGSNNIYLGANVFGVPGESNTMYLGRVGTQTRTVIAGVRGTATGNANAIPVLIDSAGELGTISSSRRYKEDIHDMADASRRLLDLRPVTFRYTQAFTDGAKPIQFGLIAEEVAEAFPELVVRDEEGRPETVQYHNLSVLLLNELQKLQREVAALRQERRQ